MTARTSFSVLLCLLTVRAAFSLQSQPTRSFSRREWLSNMATTAATATTILPQAANADPSVVSGLQGGIQDKVAPGHWIGQFIGLNSKTENWDFPNSTPEEVSKALVDVLTSLTEDRKAKLYMPEFEIQTADASKLHVLTWTKLEWLDTLDVTFRPKENNGCTATASFYATGFLPTNIPGAPLFNVAFFWFPFASPGPRGEMLQSFRLRALNGLVTKRLEENKVTPDLYFP